MVVVFNSADVAPAERVDAVYAAIQNQSVPSTVELADPDNIRCVLDVARYGDVGAVHLDINGYRHVWSEKMTRHHPIDKLSLAVHFDCGALQQQYDTSRRIASRELMFMDFTQPFRYAMASGGSATCIQVPIDAVGLPHEVTRAAAGRLAASPLYALMINHIADITVESAVLATGSQAPVIGDTTVELTRALLASAYDTVYARGTLTELLMPRIRAYIKQHLTDPELSPESIATAHDISLRHLFKLCSDANFSLEQWIITERLAGARDDLARPEMHSVPIAHIARRWGFVNSAHFSRRFRLMFGLSPRSWRHISAKAIPVADDRY